MPVRRMPEAFVMCDRILIIPGRLPGMNEYTAAQRSNQYKGAGMKRQAQMVVGLCIKSQLRGLRIDKRVRLHYLFVEKNRKRDMDNISGFAHKVIQDALVECGVLTNDGWRNIAGYSDDFAVNPERPHIEVRIEVVEDAKISSDAATRLSRRDGRPDK